MREHPTESEVNNDWLDGDNLFYRKADKSFYLKAISAVENEDKSLIVIGDEGVLDHFCRMLISKLKDNSLFKLEVFLSTSKDGLLKRFNQMLSNLSIDEARQAPSPKSAVQLLVINDAGAIKDQEWALLTRLIRDFPGANVRCAMFVDKTSSLDLEGKIEKLGRKVHKWLVHAPTLDEVSDLKLVGAALGKNLEVEKLLKLAGLHEDRKIEVRTTDEFEQIIDTDTDSLFPNMNSESESDKKVQDSFVKNERSGSTDETEKKIKSKIPILSLLFLFSVSIGLMNFLYPDRLVNFISNVETSYNTFSSLIHDQRGTYNEEVGEIDDFSVDAISENLLQLEVVETDDLIEVIIKSDQNLEPSDYFIEELGNATTVTFPSCSIDDSSPISIANVAHPQINSIELRKEDNITRLYVFYDSNLDYSVDSGQDNLILKFVKPSYLDSMSTVEAPLENQNPAVVNQPATIEIDSSEDTETPEELTNEVTSLKEINREIETRENNLLRNSINIVQSSSNTAVFLQHIVFAEISQAITYIESYTGLEAALIVPISSGNRELIAVLSGPFANAETAENWAKSFDFSADYWIRSAGSLKTVLLITTELQPE